jgi:PAS domain S-box-containing protein
VTNSLLAAQLHLRPAARLNLNFPSNTFRGMTRAEHSPSSLYQLLVDQVEDYAIFALDPSGCVISWNSGAARLKGYAANEIIGRHFSAFYPEEDLRKAKPGHELEVAAEVGRFEDEGWRLRKDGSRFWANVVITALRDETGLLVGFARITRDLTARRAAEKKARELAAETAARAASEEQNRELEELNGRLMTAIRSAEIARRDASAAEEREREARTVAENANRAKGEFLAAMSHELRTPLNAIAGHIDLLSMDLYGPLAVQQREALGRIKRAQQHLLGLIDDLLSFARIEGGKVEYRLQTVVLQELMTDVAPMIGPQLSAKGLRYDVRLPDDRIEVAADREKLIQIILNLLSNAVKFTESGGTIAVSETRADGAGAGRTLNLRVSDTGIGIPKDKLQAIFDPFVQLATSHSARHEGTGLGLAISRDLARGMGGDLLVELNSGKGATFVVVLPLSDESKS